MRPRLAACSDEMPVSASSVCPSVARKTTAGRTVKEMGCLDGAGEWARRNQLRLPTSQSEMPGASGNAGAPGAAQVMKLDRGRRLAGLRSLLAGRSKVGSRGGARHGRVRRSLGRRWLRKLGIVGRRSSSRNVGTSRCASLLLEGRP